MRTIVATLIPVLVSTTVFAADIDKSARWHVGQDNFAGARYLFTSNDAHDIATWLIAHDAYKQPPLADAGYLLREKGGPTVRQGTPEFDLWIDRNRTTK